MRVWVILALAVAACGSGQGPRQPAELPPPGYASRLYVDSQGCRFVRVGPPEQPSWVAEVTLERRQICGARPSAGDRIERQPDDREAAPVPAAATEAEAPPAPPAPTEAEASPEPAAPTDREALIAEGIVPDPVVAPPPGPVPVQTVPRAPATITAPLSQLRENYVQVAVFSDVGPATTLADTLRRNAFPAQVRRLRIRGEERSAVVIGPLASERLVASVVDDMRAAGFDAFPFVSQ